MTAPVYAFCDSESDDAMNKKRHPAATAAPRVPIEGRDRVWLQDSPVNLMVIHSVFTVDSMDVATFRELWDSRVMRAADGARWPRFTLRVVRAGGRYYWQEDADFHLDRHILEVHRGFDGEPIRDKARLQAYIGRLASQPLPDDRPRWQIQLIPEFGDGGTAVIVRIHHCMGDGIALVPVLFSLMDGDASDTLAAGPSAKGGGKPPSKAALVLKASLVGPFLLAQKMLWRRDRSVLHGRPLVGEKKVAWTDPIDLALVKRIKDALGATVNDVLVSCVAGAFQRHVAQRSGEALERLRVSMPVNVRAAGEELRMENRFAAVLTPLPPAAPGPRRRVAATKQRMNALKRSIEPFFTYGVVHLMLKVLPASWSRPLIDFLANKCTSVLSNVPGPQQPVTLGGRKLRAMLFWVPQRADVGIGISLLSFAGSLRMGVFSDVELLADPAELVRCFEQELEELREAVGL